MKLLALGMLSVLASAQPPGIIRSESRLVLVDTVVTDKKGAYVSGLTQKDFRVFEDNKEQTVKSFSVEAGDSQPRYTVLFFDNSTAGPGETFARQAAARFIENSADKNRLIAVAEYTTSLSVTQNFTSDLAKLRRAAGAVKLPGARTIAMPGAAGQATQNNYTTGNALSALRTLTRGLASLPGRKSIIFVSSGFADSDAADTGIAAVVSACNKANVAIYPVGASIEQLKSATPTGGLADGPTVATSIAGMRTAMRNGLTLDDTSSGAQQALTSLASGTGGFMILNTGDLAAGFDKVGEEQREYYLLAYTPSGEARPGACHTLKVRLAKTGDSVRSRSGYCEALTLDALAGTPTERDLEAKINASAAPNVVGAQMRQAFFYTGTNDRGKGEARVDLALEVPSAALAFTKEKNRLHAVFNIIGIVSAEDGSPVSRFSDTVRLESEDKKPLHYSKQFPMLPGKYTLKVVFSGAAGRFGRLEAPLNIEPWDQTVFALSGLALGTVARPSESLTGADDGLTEDRVALVAGGFEVVPSGISVVSRSGQAFVYAEVYEPALAMSGVKASDVPAVGVRMELVDPATGKVKKDFGLVRLHLPVPSGKTAIPVGLTLSAPELETGVYKLRLSALDAKGHAAVRTIGIRLDN